MALRLDAHARSILQIIFPFGIYKYQVLPMGVKPATDLFQSQMIQLYAPMKERSPICYIDDILHCAGNSLQDHLIILGKILGRLATAGLQVNADKSEWCKQEINYLGFTITPTGYKPMREQVKAILVITPPKSIKELQGFIGCVNFIKNHIPRQAELMQPLTKLTKKEAKFQWGPEAQQAFLKTKAAVAEAVMLT